MKKELSRGVNFDSSFTLAAPVIDRPRNNRLPCIIHGSSHETSTLEALEELDKAFAQKTLHCNFSLSYFGKKSSKKTPQIMQDHKCWGNYLVLIDGKQPTIISSTSWQQEKKKILQAAPLNCEPVLH